MNMRPHLPAAGLWLGLAVMIGGRLLDLSWHAGHDRFETATDQLRAHWLVWLGAFIVLVAASLARSQRLGGPAVSVVIVGALGYAAVAAWHFYEHSELRDPELPHVLIVLTQITILVGVPFAALTVRRQLSRISER